MDRDKRWERIKEAYDLIVKGIGTPTTDILDAMQKSYDAGVTDEFMKPIVVVDDKGEAVGSLKRVMWLYFSTSGTTGQKNLRLC